MAKAKKPGTALMSMADIEAMYAAESIVSAKAAPQTGGTPFISTQSEMFRIGETDLPDPLECIVVAESLINIWYSVGYSAQQKSPPDCFATAPIVELNEDGRIKEGTGEGSMISHPTSPNRQGGEEFRCETCELNTWGSAEQGKGKACSNRRNLGLVFTADPALKHPTDALQLVTMQLSPTALEPWGKFVKNIANAYKRPPHGVIVRFSFDKKNKNENLRKRVIPVDCKLITDAQMAVRINQLRAQVLTDGVMTRPIPIVTDEKPGMVKAKAKPKTGPSAISKARAVLKSKGGRRGK